MVNPFLIIWSLGLFLTGSISSPCRKGQRTNTALWPFFPGLSVQSQFQLVLSLKEAFQVYPSVNWYLYTFITRENDHIYKTVGHSHKNILENYCTSTIKERGFQTKCKDTFLGFTQMVCFQKMEFQQTKNCLCCCFQYLDNKCSRIFNSNCLRYTAQCCSALTLTRPDVAGLLFLLFFSHM